MVAGLACWRIGSLRRFSPILRAVRVDSLHSHTAPQATETTTQDQDKPLTATVSRRMSSLDTEHMLKSGWWLPYVKPSRMWETMNGYNVSLGLLRSKPPSADLEKEQVQAYLAGLLEGEGYFYYSRHHNGYFPCVYLRMCEAAPVRFFSRIMKCNCDLGSTVIREPSEGAQGRPLGQD